MTSERHGSDSFSFLYSVNIKPIHNFISRINKLKIRLTRIFILPVNCPPFKTAKMLKSQICYALKVTVLSVPELTMHRHPS